MFFLFASVAFAQLSVYDSNRCPSVNVTLLTRNIVQPATRSAAIHLFFTNESFPSSVLFTAARHITDPDANATYVVADCVSNRIGIDFSVWRVGMDCGAPYAAHVMAGIDALDYDDEFTIKLGHLLAHVPEWQESETCAVWSDEVSAWVFWLSVFIFVYAGRRVCSRQKQS